MPKKIIIVDDEPNIVKMIESRLRANGYDVIVACDGQQGLDSTLTESPDLVILDLMLPQLDGFEVCARIRADEKHKNTPIVMLTARGNAEDIRTGMGKGADAYIAKPFNPTVLLGIIEGLIGK